MIRKFWEKRGTHIVLITDSNGTHGYSLRLTEDREIQIGRPIESYLKLIASERIRQSRLLPSVILAASADLARTILVPISFKRTSPKIEMTSPELENILGQAVTRNFSNERATVGERLGVEDLDAILVGARVDNFQVDGRAVLDPIGLPGLKVEGNLALTFAVRPLFEKWQRFFNSGEGFFFVPEAYAACASLLRADVPQTAVVSLANQAARCDFLVERKGVRYAAGGPLKWSPWDLVRRVSEKWPVSETSAKEFLRRAGKRELSGAMQKEMENIWRASFRDLSGELSDHGLSRGSIKFLPNEDPVCKLVPLPREAGKFIFERFSATEVANILGFEVKKKWNSEISSQAERCILPFLEFYYDRSNSRVNHWLRRRVHWLSPVRGEDKRVPV